MDAPAPHKRARTGGAVYGAAASWNTVIMLRASAAEDGASVWRVTRQVLEASAPGLAARIQAGTRDFDADDADVRDFLERALDPDTGVPVVDVLVDGDRTTVVGRAPDALDGRCVLVTVLTHR